MMVANLLVLFLLLTSSNAFLRTVDSPMRAPHFMKNAHHYLNGHNSMKSLAFVPLFASSSRDKKERDKASVILTSSEDGEDIDGSIFENAETGQPPDWMVMKELLGINIFTYILAGVIVLFLSLNFFLGPGWLGQVLGIEGTGSITKISDSFPDSVDLSSPEFKLDI